MRFISPLTFAPALKVNKATIAGTEPMTVSLMPEGLLEGLSEDERRDLMTYLLLEKAPKQ